MHAAIDCGGFAVRQVRYRLRELSSGFGLSFERLKRYAA